MSTSPVFSPSSSSTSPLFAKPSPFTPSPEKQTLIQSPSASPSSSSAALKLRLPKPPIGLLRTSNDVVRGSSSSSTSTLSTKKKKKNRPAKIDVPMPNLSMWYDLATAEQRRSEVVEFEGEGYSVCCKRGRREAMEDRYVAILNIGGDSNQAFFGVFDGHGGDKAAEFSATNLHKNVIDQVEKLGDQDIQDAVKRGYLITDLEFLMQDSPCSGSCCVTVLIKKGNLVVSNAGDCRAVISRGGVAEALTSDHRPSREDEKSRIETLGGYVDCCHKVWRIQGSLAVSRGIGDQHLKQWVTAEPETKVLRIEPEFEFLILASDGLWDKVSNQEAIDIARFNGTSTYKLEALAACKRLVNLSVSRGSADDICVMLIQLGHFCP